MWYNPSKYILAQTQQTEDTVVDSNILPTDQPMQYQLRKRNDIRNGYAGFYKVLLDCGHYAERPTSGKKRDMKQWDELAGAHNRHNPDIRFECKQCPKIPVEAI